MSCAGAAMCRLTVSWSNCLLLIVTSPPGRACAPKLRDGVQHPVVAVAQLEQRLAAVALERRAVHQCNRVDVQLRELPDHPRGRRGERGRAAELLGLERGLDD